MQRRELTASDQENEFQKPAALKGPVQPSDGNCKTGQLGVDVHLCVCVCLCVHLCMSMLVVLIPRKLGSGTIVPKKTNNAFTVQIDLQGIDPFRSSAPVYTVFTNGAETAP